MLPEEKNEAIKHLAKQFIAYLNNKKIGTEKVKDNPLLFLELLKNIVNAEVARMLDKDPLSLVDLTDDFKRNKNFVQDILDKKFFFPVNGIRKYSIPPEFKRDKILVQTFLALNLSPDIVLRDCEFRKTDTTMAVIALEKNLVKPGELSKEVINDANFLCIILQKNLYAKEIFGRWDFNNGVFKDKTLCLTIVDYDARAFTVFPPEHKSDLTILKRALKKDSSKAIKLIDKSLIITIKEFAIIALQHQHIEFSELVTDLQNDTEVCLAFLNYCLNEDSTQWENVSKIPVEVWQKSISVTIEQIEEKIRNFLEQEKLNSQEIKEVVSTQAKSENVKSRTFCEVVPNWFKCFQLKQTFSLDDQKVVEYLLNLQERWEETGEEFFNKRTFFYYLDKISNDSEIKDKPTVQKAKDLVCTLMENELLYFYSFRPKEPLREDPQILLKHFDIDAKNLNITKIWDHACEIPENLANDEKFLSALKNKHPEIHQAYLLKNILKFDSVVLIRNEYAMFREYLEKGSIRDSEKLPSYILYKLVVGRLFLEKKIEITEISRILNQLPTLEERTVNPHKHFQPPNRELEIFNAVSQIPSCIFYQEVLSKIWDPKVKYFIFLNDHLNFSQETVPGKRQIKFEIVQEYLANKDTIQDKEKWIADRLKKSTDSTQEKDNCIIV